nr:hypothetical protein [Tanacetum cinerariifolium]
MYDKKHAFNLSYFPVENHAAEYFCDIYVNKYINIKFRGSHSIKDHQHSDLSFVQGLASDGERALQYKLIFKCSQCKFTIHYDCYRALNSYRDEDEDFDDDELSNSNSD